LPCIRRPADTIPHTEGQRVMGERRNQSPIGKESLLAQVLDRTNLMRALKQVKRNKGAAGVDGMTVEELPEYLIHHWPEIKS